MKAWQRTDDGSDKTKVGFRTVIHKKFTMNDGNTIDADISDVEGNQAVLIIPLTAENDVIIARQFRCGPELVMDEIPGGLVDPGEEPEQAARRELREEVGYDSDELEYIGKAYLNAWSNTYHHYFIARNCHFVSDPDPEEFEEVEVVKISIQKLIDNAKNARMTDVQGVFLALDTLNAIMEGTA